ncbi:MAG: hypothetical protein WC102_02750 [Saccharofermentanales bacterium]
MTHRRTMAIMLTIIMIMASFAMIGTGASAVETLPTTDDISNREWWPTQPMTVENDATSGTKITFGANTAWGVRAVGMKGYALDDLEVTLVNVSMPNAGAGIFINFADRTTNEASDPGATSLFLYIHNTASGYDVNVMKRPGGEELGVLNFNGAISSLIVRFEELTDGSWLLLVNNKDFAISEANMNSVIADQGNACFSIGNNNPVADPTSLNVFRIRNVPFRTDLKPQAANFVNPYWGAMVEIANDATNGTDITFAAGTSWGPRAIGQDIFNLNDLEITLTNVLMPNPGAGIFIHFADYDINPVSDPDHATGAGLYYYISNTAEGYTVELIDRPSTSLVAVPFTGTIPSTLRFGFTKDINGDWIVRLNDKNILGVSNDQITSMIPNTERVCFSIGNNNNVADPTSLNVTSIKYLDAAAAPTEEPTTEPEPTVAVTPTVEPTPIVNSDIDVPNEGDFLNPFWADSLILVTPLDQERGIQVDFPGTSAWGVRAVGTQIYELDGLEMDLTEFSISGDNRQFIMMIVDGERNSAADPTERGILLVYSLEEGTGDPMITLWARPFYEGDLPLATYHLENDITDEMLFMFEQSGDEWVFTINSETFTLSDDLLRTSIPNPSQAKFAPGFGATDSNGLSFIISRVTNKIVAQEEESSSETSSETTDESEDDAPQTGDRGIYVYAIVLLSFVAFAALAGKRRVNV